MGNASFRRPHLRSLTACAAVAAAVALSGCNIEGNSTTAKALKPISDKLVAEIDQKNMTKESPILVRIYKEESELEVWKEDRTGRYTLLKTYPICRWSGELGPKIKEGDRQAPEGFYSITPGQMNPNSSYYLSFNLGYPNAYDKSLGRTGMHLMVHGDCSSRGCYSMTDEQIGEIYALARESFFGGQKAFQVQAFPFRMTAQNMAKHRNNPHLAFWKMLKQGSDHFEITRMEPKVDVCERKYVFDAAAPENATKPLKFAASASCPEYEVPGPIADAVGEKQQRDEVQYAALVSANVPTAPIRTGTDGGMNPVFLAAMQPSDSMADGPIRAMSLASANAPGTVPAHAVAPGSSVYATAPEPLPQTEPVVAVSTPAPVRTASAGGGNVFGNLFSSKETSAARKTETKGSSSGGVFDRLTRMVGLRGSAAESTPVAATPAPAKTKVATRSAAPALASAKAEPQMTPPPRPAASIPETAAKPRPLPPEPVRTASGVATVPATMPGAQPVLPGSNFDSRFGAFR